MLDPHNTDIENVIKNYPACLYSQATQPKDKTFHMRYKKTMGISRN